ncbi:periostin isoform X1 [Alosa pseudoharengus]|uniref:periostin isoform X1 n=1 Tax=Alosa pseudoharengus TaxID=34774 RepID=UPI003F8C3E92
MKLVFAASFALLVLSSLDLVDSSAYDKIVSHSRIRAKKQGPNVCALQQVMGTNKKYFSTCRNWYKGSICGKKTMVLYECCPGYMKLDGMLGCPAVAPIDHVYGTLGLVGATTTQRYADISSLRAEIEGRGSFTMFAPSNDAWDLLDASVKAKLEGSPDVELNNALHYHMINKRLVTKDLKNDLTLKSMHNSHGLRINHYSNGVVTVNCARIIHGNQVSTNGVVHVIDRVLTLVEDTIHNVLDKDEDLSSLRTVAEVSGLMDTLKKPGQYTLFAPTNTAFDKIEGDVMERLMSDTTILQALLQYHLLNSVQCSEAIMAGAVYETMEGSTIEIGCDGNSLTVNGIKMVLKKDIVTTNGVIHLIDQVLIPNAAKLVMELVSESTFKDMVSELGLAAAMQPETEYTLLAPLNGAFTEEVMSMDQRLLKIILENHILKLKVSLSELYNGQELETLGGKLLRVFIYRTAVCIENACMVRGSKEGSNGALHLMRSIIKPPESTMFDLLIADGRFKIFLSLMDTAGLIDLLKQTGAYTLFAPTDNAFEVLSEEDMALLTSDPNALRTILLYHFSKGVFINGGLEGGVTNLLTTIQGNNLQLLSVNNSIHVNSIDVPDNDIMASNGVVHVVKTLLYPGDLPVGRQDLYLLLQKLIKYIQIKFVSGFTYREIPLTFLTRTITKTTTTTRIVETAPEITKVTRVITKTETDPTTVVTRVIESGEPTITKVTRVIEGEPTFTKVTRVLEGEPTITKVTRVVEGEPTITKVTRVVEGTPTITKVTRVVEAEAPLTTVTRVITGESEPTVTRVVVEGEPTITKVTRVVEGDPSLTKVTRVIETHTSSDGELDTDGEIRRIIEEEVSKVKKVLESEVHILQEEEIKRIIEGGGPGLTTVTKVIRPEPQIIEGPDFSRITSFQGNSDLIEAESEKITKIIQEGGPTRLQAKRAPVKQAGMRRRNRLVRRHPKRTQ